MPDRTTEPARDATRSGSAGRARCWSCGGAPAPRGTCPRCGAGESVPAAAAGVAGALARVGKGVAAPLRGLLFLNRHPRLWTWIAVPLLLNALLCGAVAWLLGDLLSDWLPDFAGPWPGWIDWAREALAGLLEFLAWAAAILVAALTALTLAGVVNAPFYDLLSERVEAAHFGRADPGRPWSALLGDLLRSLAASLSLLLRYLAVMAVLLLLSFTVVGAPLLLLAGLYFGGLAQVDVTLSRKLYPGARRSAWARRHAPLLLGLGLPVSLLPPLMPFGIVGATLAWLEEPDKE